MRPMISNAPYYRLTIPELSGGVNLRDNISLIADNQLTNCKNVWYKDGMLKTRPGIAAKIFGNDYTVAGGVLKTYTDEKNFRVIDGISYFLVCLQFRDKLKFYYYSDDSVLEVATIDDFIDVFPNNQDFNCNIFQFETDIYCFTSLYYEDYNALPDKTPFFIYKITQTESGWKWVKITQNEIYAPIVAYNGSPYVKKNEQTKASAVIDDSQMLEGYNLLGNRMRMYYSTVNKDRLGEIIASNSHYMSYAIAYPNGTKNIKHLIPEIFTVNIDNGEVVAEHKVAKENGNNGFMEDGYNDVDGRMLYVNYYDDVIKFRFESNNGEAANVVTEADYIPNNMEIIAPCENSRENYEKVLNMTASEWYGGDSEGLYGGIHLFLGGNTNEKEKALVIWSDMKNPLYFSENCYAYVGDKTQKVTAFGKQGEALIIAKEKEMYATQYSSAEELITLEEAENQTNVDITASEVIFPMTQVHGFIGCDCPKTMVLCRNRLVWANTDGKVYTLVSPSQYTERSIYEVSDMVLNELSKYTLAELKNSKAADWQGHYVLIVKNRIYLMDYNSYGFSNVYSYTKTEDAQVRIPWWIWELPSFNLNESLNKYDGDEIVFSTTGELSELYLTASYKISIPDDDGGYFDLAFPVIFKFDKNATTDVLPHITGDYSEGYESLIFETAEKEISSKIQTKFFDFGAPTIKKTIPKIEVSFGTNGGVPIKTTVITESANEENEIVIEEPEEEKYSVGYFQNRLIRPANKHACRVGIKFEAEGDISVDAISLQYKHIGGLK